MTPEAIVLVGAFGYAAGMVALGRWLFPTTTGYRASTANEVSEPGY